MKLISLQSRGNTIVRVVETSPTVIWATRKIIINNYPHGFIYSDESLQVFSGRRRDSIRAALLLATQWLEGAKV